MKLETFAKILDALDDQGAPLSRGVVQKIYSCFGFGNAVELYDLSAKKQFQPYLMDGKILAMARRHDRLFELAVEVGAVGQERLAALAKKQIVNKGAHTEELYSYLTTEGFEKLDEANFVVAFLTDNGRRKVKSRYAQRYIRSNAKAQEVLVKFIVDANLGLQTTGVLSILGVLLLLERGVFIDLSGVYNIFEDITITPTMKEKILSYPYLKLMYGDTMNSL